MALFQTNGTAVSSGSKGAQIDFLEKLRNFIVSSLGAAWDVENLAVDPGISTLSTQGPISQGPDDLQMTIKLDLSVLEPGRVPDSCFFSFLTGDGPPTNFGGVNWLESDFMAVMPHTGYTADDGSGNGVHMSDQPGNPDDNHTVVSLPSLDDTGGEFDFWIWGDDGVTTGQFYIIMAFKIQTIYWQSLFVGSFDMYPGVNGGYYCAGTAEKNTARARFNNLVRAGETQWEFGNFLGMHKTHSIQAPVLLHDHQPPINPLIGSNPNSIVPAAFNNWTRTRENNTGGQDNTDKLTTHALLSFQTFNTGAEPDNAPDLVHAVFDPITKANQGNAVSTLVCPQLFMPKNETESNQGIVYGPAGFLPGAFYVDGTNLVPEDILTIGVDTYFVFPGMNSNVDFMPGQQWHNNVFTAILLP